MDQGKHRPASAPEPVPRSLTVGERLVRAGVITREQLEEGLEAQSIFGGRIGTNLIELGYLDERTLNRVLAEKHAVPTLDDGVADPAPDRQTLESIPQDLVAKYRVFPLRREHNRLYVLMEDPSNLAQLDELAFRTGLVIKPCVASEIRMAYLLERYFKIRRDQRYVVLSDERRRGKKSVEETPREVQNASEAMRLNWFAPVDTDKPEEDVWTLTEEDELCPEDVHNELMAGRKQGDAPARPPDPRRAEITRNPDALASLPETQGGPLGRRLRKAARRISGGAQASAPVDVRQAVSRLGQAATRDEIADIVLEVARTRCRRAALFVVQRDAILGWDGTGEGVDVARLRVLRIPVNALSMFQNTIDARAPLVCNPALDGDKPEMRRFLAGLGGSAPRSALLVPIVIRDRVVNLFYGDNGPDGEAPDRVEEILGALRGVPLAFASLLRKRKAMVTD